MKRKNVLVELLLCIFSGYFGAHKFYVGKKGMGFAYLLTFGLFGFGWVVDILVLVVRFLKEKKEKDAQAAAVAEIQRAAAEKREGYRRQYIAFDLETTGLSSVKDRIIEISAVSFIDFKPCDSFSTLVNPGMPIPADASKINHIFDSDVADAPSEEEAIKRFCDFIGPDAVNGTVVLVAHNAEFDTKFLKRALSRCKMNANLSVEDTLKLCQKANLNLPNNKLGTVAKHFGIAQHSAHRAEDDARVCGEIFARLV